MNAIKKSDSALYCLIFVCDYFFFAGCVDAG